jgi:hypothetical protein
VREPERRDHVAERPDALDVGAAVLVDGDEAAVVDLDAGGVEPGALGDRAATDGDEQQVGLQLLVALGLDRAHDPSSGGLDVGDLHAGHRGDAALAEGAADLLGGVGVLERQQPVLELDDGDLDAERVPGGGELHADRARSRGRSPSFGSSSRCSAWSEEMIRSPSNGANGSSRGLEPVATTIAGALTRAGAVLGLDLDGVRVGERAGADDRLDPAALERALQALPHLVDDAVLVLR